MLFSFHPIVGLFRLKTLALILLMSAMIFAPIPAFKGLVGVVVVRADDDDGGGRNRGGRDRNNSSSGTPIVIKKWKLPRFFKQKPKRTVRRAAPRVVKAPVTEEPGTLIALGLRNETLDTLRAAGFTVIVRKTLTALEGDVVKLAIPRNLTISQARQRVRSAQPGAIVDFNHFYRPQSDACTGNRCLVRHMAGWPIPSPGLNACRPVEAVGLIDTRINADHPSLAEAKVTRISLEDRESRSDAQHGTAVAALLVGTGEVPGLLPGWELIAIDAFDKGNVADGFDLVQAIDRLVARKVGVINMSLSGPANAVLEKTITAAAAKDIVLVAAAGNDGPRAEPRYPAAYPEVIAVTAIDRNKRPYRLAAQGDHIDIAAPGVAVWTAASVRGQRPRNGTSFASPFVAAAAALIKAANPGFSNEEVAIVLENEAQDLGSPGKDKVFGWGLVDVRRICR